MRATTTAGVVVCVVLGAAAGAVAQPAAPPPQPDAAYQPAPPPPTTTTTGYYTPPATPYTPAPAPRRSWFGILGLGGMGYVGRERTPFDDGDKGSGVLLEAAAGKWIRDDVAIGGRLEAHTDDSKHYTDSSFTLVVRFPVTASGRFYVEPGLGLAFHKDENNDETQSGIAVALTGGYQLLRRRFACDLRFGLAHYRHDEDGVRITDSHGLVWFGIGLGFQ